ncbi:MAG: glycosyltransferase family 39 protein [bacterium]
MKSDFSRFFFVLQKLVWVVYALIYAFFLARVALGTYARNYFFYWVLLVLFPLISLSKRFFYSFPKINFSRARSLLFSKDLLAITFGMLLFSAFTLPNLNSWKYSVIGDEFAFREYAKEILSGAHTDFFSASNQYEFPALSSYFQAGVMKLFGSGNFGWRLSSWLVVLLSLPFLYFILRQLYSFQVALSGILLLALCPFYAISGYLGYNNSQAFFPILASMACTLWAVRRNNLATFYVAGVLAGLGFYTFQTAILAVVLAFPFTVGILSDKLPDVRGNFKKWMRSSFLFVCGVVVTALPVLIHIREYLGNITTHTGQASTSTFFFKFGTTFLSFIFYRIGWHFIVGNPFLITTSVLALVGMFVLLFKNQKGKNLYILATYTIVVFFTGILDPSPYYSITRTMMVIPWVTLFAAVGFCFLGEQLSFLVQRFSTISTKFLSVPVFVLLLGCLVSERLLREKELEAQYRYTTLAQLVRLAQEFPQHRIVYVLNQQKELALLEQVTDAYDFGSRLIGTRQLTDEMVQKSEMDSIIVVKQDAEPVNSFSKDLDAFAFSLSSAEASLTVYSIGSCIQLIH